MYTNFKKHSVCLGQGVLVNSLSVTSKRFNYIGMHTRKEDIRDSSITPTGKTTAAAIRIPAIVLPSVQLPPLYIFYGIL